VCSSRRAENVKELIFANIFVFVFPRFLNEIMKMARKNLGCVKITFIRPPIRSSGARRCLRDEKGTSIIVPPKVVRFAFLAYICGFLLVYSAAWFCYG